MSFPPRPPMMPGGMPPMMPPFGFGGPPMMPPHMINMLNQVKRIFNCINLLFNLIENKKKKFIEATNDAAKSRLWHDANEAFF